MTVYPDITEVYDDNNTRTGVAATSTVGLHYTPGLGQDRDNWGSYRSQHTVTLHSLQLYISSSTSRPPATTDTEEDLHKKINCKSSVSYC